MSDYLAIIPARSGSVGLKNKNKLKFHNKPLIFWTIESALKSKFIKKIIVTSDDNSILSYKKIFGSKKILFYKRPRKYSTNNAKIYDVIKDCINKEHGNFKKFILLQPTSPLRNYKHIDDAIQLFDKTKSSTCISVVKIKKTVDSFYKISKNNYLKLNNKTKINTNRQVFKQYYEINGAIYISSIDNYIKHKTFKTNKTICYIMESKYSVDIDDFRDFKIAEYFKKLKYKL